METALDVVFTILMKRYFKNWIRKDVNYKQTKAKGSQVKSNDNIVSTLLFTKYFQMYP